MTVGIWVVASALLGRPVYLGRPYPCLCNASAPCSHKCPCRGRTDYPVLPTGCCAVPVAVKAFRGRAAGAR